MKTLIIKTVAIFLGIFSILEIIEMFGVAKVENYGLYGLTVVSIISIVGAIVFFLKEKTDEGKEKEIEKEKLNRIKHRMGVKLSSEKPEKEIEDHKHEYSLIKRRDFLDYTKGDFVSVRRLEGKCLISNSSYLLYREATDAKTNEKELIIRAFDVLTGDELEVEFIGNQNEKRYLHDFKIKFRVPLKEGELFKIEYFMKIPGELKQLSEDREMMSISLNRYKKNIEMLDFGIFLRFDILNVSVFLKDEKDKCKESNIKPQIENKNIEVEKVYTSEMEGNIQKILRKYISINDFESFIRIECNNPQKVTYILEYKKGVG